MANRTALEMDDETHRKITAHTDRGNEFFEAEQYPQALEEYQKAVPLIPQPVEDWEAAMWVFAGIGDCHFMMREYPQAHEAFSHAVACAGGLGNWFIHLRLGESQFELGNLTRARDELARAYMGHGREAFAHEHPKYYAFLRTQMTHLDK